MRVPINSCFTTDHPQFAVISNNSKWGFGVFSYHVVKQDANYNANIVNGKVVPVDWANDEMIVYVNCK